MALSLPLILAIGDSLVAGYGLTASDSFPGQLERRLSERYSAAAVVNAGKSGDMTGDVLKRLLPVLSQITNRPDLAIVQVGPNDVLQQVPPASTRANLDAILTELSRCGIPVLLTTVAPPALLRDRAERYLGIHEALADHHKVMACPFFPNGILGRSGMVLADRVHPNAKAIGLVVDAMLPVIEQALNGRTNLLAHGPVWPRST